eukprot:TRINITY_DN337_c2_g1_i1.p1 TRINITY_DN337_c2_g1~~TRINITY_DN337_c2_g1_i1.p1  ORF type:complete len:834 (-),score=315.38 TRINITY_DN337_c2_g1_i1:87-2588(-)
MDRKKGKKKGPLPKASKKVQKLRQHAQKANPFEIRTSRKKFSVVGGLKKGERPAKIAEARAAGHLKRSRTIGVELQRKGNVNLFLDRRLGEHNGAMTDADRMLLRLQKERYRQIREQQQQQREDDDMEEEESGQKVHLTHMGKRIFEDEDDDDAGEGVDELFDRIVEGEGGEGEGEGSGRKTHQEIMDEVMQKSKAFKAERVAENAEQDLLVSQIDDAFSGLSEDLLEKYGRGSKRRKVSSDDGVVRENPHKEERMMEKDDEEEDDFDALKRQLIEDERARASERAKTEEEVAQEEHERLVRLEKDRLLRMKGEQVDGRARAEEDGAEMNADQLEGDEGGDDLDDGLDLEDVEDEDEDGDKMEDIGEDLVDDVDEENGDVDDINDVDDDDDDDDDVMDNEMGHPSMKSNMMGVEDVPFVLEMPDTFASLRLLLLNRTSHARIEILRRILKSNHWSLRAENRKKIERFVQYLVHFFYETCVMGGSRDIDHIVSDGILALLHEIVPQFVLVTVACCRRWLSRIQSKCMVKKEGVGIAYMRPLRLREILLILLCGRLFPTSDKRHPVTTPAMLLLCESLVQAFYASVNDLEDGIACVGVCLYYLRLSHRYCPELVSFLMNAIVVSSGCGPIAHPFPAMHTSLTKNDTQTYALMEEKRIAFRCALAMTKVMRDLEKVVAFPELAATVHSVLESVIKHNESKGTGDQHTLNELGNCSKSIQMMQKRSLSIRKPLQMQAHRAIAIRELNPKFDERFLAMKDRDVDRDVARMKKLKRRVRSEHKSAARELRKDSAFIAAESRRMAEREEAERQRRLNRLMADLQQQEHMVRSFERGDDDN